MAVIYFFSILYKVSGAIKDFGVFQFSEIHSFFRSASFQGTSLKGFLLPKPQLSCGVLLWEHRPRGPTPWRDSRIVRELALHCAPMVGRGALPQGHPRARRWEESCQAQVEGEWKL